MEYTFTTNKVKGEFLIKSDDNQFAFYLDTNPTNFSPLFVEITEELIAEDEKRAAEHRVLLELFSSNEKEAERFAEMISGDPNGGYSSYLEVMKINEILNQLK